MTYMRITYQAINVIVKKSDKGFLKH